VIQLFNVTKSYGPGQDALAEITLRVHKGEFVFLGGATGAGKSTLLRLVTAAERPTSGEIIVGGRNVSRMRSSAIPFLRRNIGFVFQDFKLLPRRTAAENVALAFEVLGLRRAETERRVSRALHDTGMLHRGGLYPDQLSGGEKQRIAIARAIAAEPPILLADEPTGNLDRPLALEVIGLFKRIHLKGTTVVIATHDESIYGLVPARVVTLARGRIVSDSGARPRTS